MSINISTIYDSDVDVQSQSTASIEITHDMKKNVAHVNVKNDGTIRVLYDLKNKTMSDKNVIVKFEVTLQIRDKDPKIIKFERKTYLLPNTLNVVDEYRYGNLDFVTGVQNVSVVLVSAEIKVNLYKITSDKNILFGYVLLLISFFLFIRTFFCNLHRYATIRHQKCYKIIRNHVIILCIMSMIAGISLYYSKNSNVLLIQLGRVYAIIQIIILGVFILLFYTKPSPKLMYWWKIFNIILMILPGINIIIFLITIGKQIKEFSSLW